MKKLIFLPIIISMLLSSCSSGDEIAEVTPGPTAEVTAEPESVKTPEPVNYDTLDSKGIGWGFVRNKGSEPQITEEQRTVLEENGGYYIDHREDKRLYLTFDEGYENGYTSKILDVLAQKEVPAAFFVTGPYLKNQTELIKRIIEEGHIVGNHTVNH